MMNNDELKGTINTRTMLGKLSNNNSMGGSLSTEEILGIINTNEINSDMENEQNLYGSMVGNQANIGITDVYLNGIEQDVRGKTAYLETTYEMLDDKPRINSVELKDDKSFEDLGANALTNTEIENLINSMI